MFAIIDKKTGAIVARCGAKAARLGDRLLVSPTVAGWEDGTHKILAVEEIDPPFDAATQLRSDWTETVHADKVVRERIVTDKTPAAIDAEIEGRRDVRASVYDDVEAVERAAFAVMIEEFNRHSAKQVEIVTAILSGSSLAEIKANLLAIERIPDRSFEDLRDAVRRRLGS